MAELRPAGDDTQLREWVACARAGNLAAFECLYKSTAGTLLRQVRRICRGHEEDVLADTYLQAWQSLCTFDDARGSVLSWLRTIAASRARDCMRRERVRHGGSDLTFDHDPDAQRCDRKGPEQLLDDLQQNSLLHAAMRSLQHEQQQVLGLAYFHDHSHTEIAGSTGMPLGTVKTLIRRSHITLRGIIQATNAT
ncbi:MAG: sigma-70 family RNA polymerase sigma factor [Ramlibacter sp.]